MPSELWFLKKDQQGPVYGPFSKQQLQEYRKKGKISDKMLVSCDQQTWQMVGQVLTEPKTPMDSSNLLVPTKKSVQGTYVEDINISAPDIFANHTLHQDDLQSTMAKKKASGSSNSQVTRYAASKEHHTTHIQNSAQPELTPSQPTTSPFAQLLPSQKFSYYEIIQELGRGGMGVVYKALDTRLNRIVALKLLLNSDGNDSMLQRFSREAEISARLSHPNIVCLYEVGSTPQIYIAMEFIEGRSFADLLQDKAYPLRKKLEIFRQVCEAVDYAHKQKIIHRDLKPHNILVTANHVAKVMDFGLAKSLSRTNVNLSSEGQLLGTPKYMSPEQADGSKVDHSTDIYSLGVILYEILTGHTPYEGDTVITILSKLANEPPILPCQINPSISKDLQTICMKCLEKKPQNRYLSARSLGHDIKAFLGNRPISIRKSSIIERSSKWVQRNKILTGLLLILLVAVAGVAYLLYEPAEEKDFKIIQTLVSQARDKEAYPEAIQHWESFLNRYAHSSHRQAIQEKIEILKNLQAKKIEARYNQLITEAKLLLTTKNYEQALKILLEAKNCRGEDWQVFMLLGTAYYQTKDWRNAQLSFEQVEKNLNRDMLFMLADAKIQQKDYEKAILTIKQVIAQWEQEQPQHIRLVECYSLLGNCYQKIQDDLQAISAYQQAKKILEKNGEPKAQYLEIYHNIALFYIHNSQTKEALKTIVIYQKLGGRDTQILKFLSDYGDFTPMSIGRKWIYANNTNPQLEVKIVDKKADKFIVKISQPGSAADDQQDDQEWYLESDFFIRFSYKLKIKLLAFQYPIKLNRTWTNKIWGKQKISTMSNIGTTVSVPAGTFHNCVTVVHQLQILIWPGTLYEYYAPEVGRVKSEVLNPQNQIIFKEELISYEE